MKLTQLAEIYYHELSSKDPSFDADFIRKVAKDRDIDLSRTPEKELERIHNLVLSYAKENMDEYDMSPEDIGQEYYDALKSYFL